MPQNSGIRSWTEIHLESDTKANDCCFTQSSAFGLRVTGAAGNRCAEEHRQAQLLGPNLAKPPFYNVSSGWRNPAWFTPGLGELNPYAAWCFGYRVPFNMFKTETAWNITVAVPYSLQCVMRKGDKLSNSAIKTDPHNIKCAVLHIKLSHLMLFNQSVLLTANQHGLAMANRHQLIAVLLSV